jgi:hypothetical protein
MRTLTEKYNGVLKGLFSKDQFLRDARMEQSQLITQHNSYNDAINILKNKGLISEVSMEEGNYKPIEYRDCLIEPGPYGGYSWHRPGWVDSIDGGGYSWSGIGDTVEDCKDQIDDYYDEYGETEESEIEEKKLTSAEKKGKEKIVKSLAKAGMSKKDPKTYAIATTQAKELYEGPAEVDTAYFDIIAKIAEHARKLNDDDAYQFHEQLKSFFNRMLENVNEESSAEVKKGDILKHKNSGVEVKVTSISYKESGEPRLYRGVIVDAGKITGLEPIDKTYQIRPTLVGTTWDIKEQISEDNREIQEEDIHLAKQKAKAMSREDGIPKYVVERETIVITYAVVNQPEAGNTIAAYENGAPIAGLNEAKDEYTNIESPKPELPLDVLHHGIRFELDKKDIGNTPTEEEYMKAFKAATKNLEKDLLHYKKEEGATEAPVSKKEEMVKMKLKENFKTIIRNILSEDTFSKKSFNIKGEVL